MTIGDRIKLRREELHLSQDDLAKRCGYKSRSSINKIESDARSLTQAKIKVIADALDTTPSYIMGWNDPDEVPLVLSEKEKSFIMAYRSHPEMQNAVDTLLGVAPSVADDIARTIAQNEQKFSPSRTGSK